MGFTSQLTLLALIAEEFGREFDFEEFDSPVLLKR
jgi:hypothetical protein